MKKDELKPDASDALPADLQAEADALVLDEIGSTATPPGTVASVTDAPPDTETGDMLAALLGITINGVIVPARGDHWTMNEDECTTLGHAYGAVIDKYFPDFNGGVEVTAIVVTLTAFGPRVAQDFALAAAAESDGKSDRPGGDDARE